MKTILRRLEWLETVGTPDERDGSIVQAILEARRRRLGPDYEPITFPAESYEGCRTVGDRITRTRMLLMERGKGPLQLRAD